MASKREHRNNWLNCTAYTFRQFVLDGDLSHEGAVKLLIAACEANGYLAKDGWDAMMATINSGLGMES